MKRNILKATGVLLIVAAMILPTVAVTANTNDDAQPVIVSPKSPTVNKQVNPRTLDGIVVWDNEMNYDTWAAAQYDDSTTPPFDAYPADDFHFEEDTEVGDVHWIGGYFNPPEPAEFEWCISFMNDDGTGNAPLGHPQDPGYAGPFCYTWEEIEKVDLGGGYYEMSVDLPEDITFPGCNKYWISIWGEGAFPPQSSWGMHTDPIKLHQAVFRSDYFGYPQWTDTEVVFQYPYDMCFQMTTRCKPSINVEKYVWDPATETWVDADTANEALDLPICTDAKFKIVIHNNGTCCDFYKVEAYDEMHDSLKYISADPKPDNVIHQGETWHINWYNLSKLSPCQTIVINLTAHVEGPECSTDRNLIQARGYCKCQPLQVVDSDSAYVHAVKKARVINTTFLNFLQQYPNLFPILQRLLLRLGLQ